MKQTGKLKELRSMSPQGLVEKVRSMEEELMKLRFQHAVGQLEKTAQFRDIRRDIARANTVMREMAIS